jgi:hypothetical protein
MKNELLSHGEISIYDNITFGTITKVVNSLFGYSWKPSKGAVHSSFKYKHDNSFLLWFPKRKKVKDGKDIAPSGWFNGLSNDGKVIYEVRDNNEIDTSIEEIVNPDSLDNFDKRITFMKYKDNLGENGYKFVGIFHYAGRAITYFNGKEVVANKYILVCNSFNLPNLN